MGYLACVKTSPMSFISHDFVKRNDVNNDMMSKVVALNLLLCRHATLLKRSVLCDNQNNGCDYRTGSWVQANRQNEKFLQARPSI